MNIKYYIATKQDKVGTAFTVARYEENEFRSTYINKVVTNGIDGIKDIVKWVINQDSGKDYNMMSFKFKDVDIATQIGHYLDKDKEIKKLSKENKCTFFSSPATFAQDRHKMEKAQSALMSYLILREHYAKKERG